MLPARRDTGPAGRSRSFDCEPVGRFRLAACGQSGDTWRVLVKDIGGARAALRAGVPADLLGLAECGWLDVKAGVYRLDDPAKALELAKDVAAFANTGTGGMILVGYTTRKDYDREIIDEVRPVRRALVDLDRYRKLIRERVIPAPRGFSVDFVHTDPETGILVIDVPAQPVALLPYVVPGPAGTAGPSRLSVAVPVREADATVWLPQPEIQRMLAAGWTATGGPSEEYLSSLIQQAVTAARQDAPPPQPAFQVGEGPEPGWKGLFRQARDDLVQVRCPGGGACLGCLRRGPGRRPAFRPGAVGIRLGYLRPAAAAAGRRRGRGLARTAGRRCRVPRRGTAIGRRLPGPGSPGNPRGQRTRCDHSTGRRAVGGGGTGARPGTGDWRWIPATRLSMNMTRSAAYWTSDQTVQQLRLRAVATFPWANAGDLAIEPDRRLELEQDLPVSHLAGAVTALSARRGAALPAGRWQRGPNRNAADALSYSNVITAPGGVTALSAEVMAALPGQMDSSVVTCADVRLVDLQAWADALAASGAPLHHDLRLSVEEVAEVLTVAWQTAAGRLTSAVAADLAGRRWAYPPTVELRVIAEARYDGTPNRQPELSDYIDLSPLGHSDRGQIREMAVTITADPQLGPDERRSQARKALTYMARQFGFLDAAEDTF